MACLVGAAPANSTTLGVTSDGRSFTIDGKPTFLLGISYYSGASVGDARAMRQDLNEIRAAGFNWIRVWATWNGYGLDASAVRGDGSIREPYMRRLRSLVAECDRRGMIVDVTLHRGDAPGNHADHLKCVRTVALQLRRYRNVYIDVANERDVRDSRYVKMEEVGELISAIKAVDPTRLCTASGVPGSKEDLASYLNEGHCSFIAPHLARRADAPAQTEARVRQLRQWMDEIGRRVPIHLQEPFRRDYSEGWQPVAADYLRDLSGARKAGAAGWCLHNGGNRLSKDGKPYRSFRMDQDRLLDQLDAVEKDVMRRAAGCVAN